MGVAVCLADGGVSVVILHIEYLRIVEDHRLVAFAARTAENVMSA
jgi:hypothetical protein